MVILGVASCQEDLSAGSYGEGADGSGPGAAHRDTLGRHGVPILLDVQEQQESVKNDLFRLKRPCPPAVQSSSSMLPPG